MRKLATAAAVSLVLATGGVRALGLGDIEMRSALNQPMNAEIRLTSVNSGEAAGMIVQLASADAFTRAGIERTTALTDLRFSVDQSSGKPVIRITSVKPVVEPFLNFLLEVQWPQGRMVREYTVLLDPPVFMTPNASKRSTAADTPTVINRGEEQSIAAPTPIERNSNSAIIDTFDESAVAIVGTAQEVTDSAAPLADGAGEIVSLDELDSVAPTAGVVVPVDGDVVVLSDLEIANPVAAEQFAADQSESQDLASNDFPEVELIGSSAEVADEFIAAGSSTSATSADSAPATDGAAAVESEIVSLDELEAQPVKAGVAKEVTVRRGDTLLQIARENSTTGVTAQQMMLALLNANQSAFINGNINLVKAGAILRIPEDNEAQALSQAEALAQISQQNTLWQEYRDNLRSNSATRIALKETTDKTETAASSSEALSSAAVSTAAPTETDSIAADAKAILDSARSEILNRDELKIVANSEPTTTAASATADESTQSDTARLGEINRKLQLAREELASSRLETGDLGEQATELESTAENLEALVTLRQNEVAQLEAQLRAAGEAADEASAVGTVQEGAADTATQAVAEAADATDNLLADASQNIADAGNDVTLGAGEVVADVSQITSDAGEVVADAGTNALTAAGQQLDQVELLEEVAAGDTAQAELSTPQVQTPWYQDLIQKYGKWLLIGIGGLSALMAGWLLFFRRRREAEEILDFGDEAEFVDAGDADELAADGAMLAQQDDFDEEFGAVAGDESTAPIARHDLADDTLSLGSETQAVAEATSDEGIDKDDTISEVDVYLAYGLHGQAEELLTKAIDRDPNNQEYSVKLLQTYHAQGNAEAYDQTATKFHARFGGDDNPQWEGIASMGHTLQPENALFAGAAATIAAVGTGRLNDPALDESDFASSGEEFLGSVNRDFSSTEKIDDIVATGDESALMDQSLDPAFAFDENDLEATGDFSHIADELKVEDPDSIDFPGFDSPGEKASSILSAGKTAAVGGLGAAVAGLTNPGIDDGLTMDELEVGAAGDAANDKLEDLEFGSVANDLTLDLDQLSGDLELDSTELLDDGLGVVGDLEIPDLTSDNDLLSGAGTTIDSSDEMDTMLDLAKAYIDMGDKDSASNALGEIVKSGTPEQVSEAQTLLQKIS